MYFTFNQNNSGGFFIEDEEYGICETIVIEADDAKDSLRKLQAIGDKYGWRFWDYCQCCGERWSTWVHDSDGTEVPQIYSTPLSEMESSWFRERAFVHHKDGRIEEVKFKEKQNV